MDIQTRKIQFVQEFLRIADDELVTKMEGLLTSERKKRIEMKFHPMTLNELDHIIEASEEDLKNGRVTDATQIKDLISTWR